MAIEFNFETMKFEGVTVEQVKFWEKCYPDVDVIDVILRKAPAWLDANPKKARKKNWKRFLVNWFSNNQKRYELLKP